MADANLKRPFTRSDTKNQSPVILAYLLRSLPPCFSTEYSLLGVPFFLNAYALAALEKNRKMRLPRVEKERKRERERERERESKRRAQEHGGENPIFLSSVIFAISKCNEQFPFFLLLFLLSVSPLPSRVSE
jgi:hypothetical protein